MTDEMVETKLCDSYREGLYNRLKNVEEENQKADHQRGEINTRINNMKENSETSVKNIMTRVSEEIENAIKDLKSCDTVKGIGDFCLKHDGFKTKIAGLEANVSKLWDKWDKGYTLILGTFVALCLNLVAVIAILIRTWPK